mmetsp:Transcript_102432/g.125253  ORF Transcript_102432/g.125253 Transcript_102432/m.125253 type:complete len:97 (-) Transcript_102432:49-339(-)
MYEIFYRMEPFLEKNNIQVAIGVTLKTLKLSFPPKVLKYSTNNEIPISNDLRTVIQDCVLCNQLKRINAKLITKYLTKIARLPSMVSIEEEVDVKI